MARRHEADAIGLDVGGSFVKGARIGEDGRIGGHLEQPAEKQSARGSERVLFVSLGTGVGGGLVLGGRIWGGTRVAMIGLAIPSAALR